MCEWVKAFYSPMMRSQSFSKPEPLHYLHYTYLGFFCLFLKVLLMYSCFTMLF